MSKQWNRKKARDLLVIFFALAAYCVIATVADLSCIIKTLTGISCPGCGMTRACLALLRLDFSAALYYHPLSIYLIIAIPIMIVLYLRDQDKLCKFILIISAIIMLAVYFYRFLIVRTPVLKFAPENGLFPRLIHTISEIFQ